MEKLNKSKPFISESLSHKEESLQGFPANTTVFVKMNKIIKRSKDNTSERLSHHMVKCASVLPVGEFVGWQMTIPTKGVVNMTLFGTKSLSHKDLEWMAGCTAATSHALRQKNRLSNCSKLYEYFLPIAEMTPSTVGFNASFGISDDGFIKWPTAYSSSFGELVEALRQEGAVFRAIIGAAVEDEQSSCRRHTLNTIDANRIDTVSYIGKPVKMRVLFRMFSSPSVRLKSVLEEAIPGSKLRYLGNTENPDVKSAWDHPLDNAQILPDCAARVMMLEPDLKESIIGIEVCEGSMKRIPASHKNTKSSGAVVIGKAEDVTGVKRKITIGELDLRRHYQIVGQTGCGKSTLLTTIVLSAIEQGHGLTLFDPHGTTVDTVIRCVPEKYAHKIRVVRIGDVEHPVPLNIWDSDDPVKEERNISDLCELFMDIFDPQRQGFVGPRYERWLSTFAKASIAFLGHRASLESIAVISQSRDNMRKVADAIAHDYPDLYEIIKNEYLNDCSSEFSANLSWYLCKFQRICGVEQCRKTLGAGTNALDFSHNIDKDMVTLIDLSSTIIGSHASRIVGTLTLMKLWNAALSRKERDKTHLVVLDEASLFQTNPLPRILAEGRKFGIGCVLCHQHTAQLTSEIRDALEANSANFSAFRLSPKDAATASIRFDDSEILTALTRLNAFNAITSLSVDGQQTAPFTLETIKPKKQKGAEDLATRIENDSIEKLVTPYSSFRALTPKEIQKMLDHPKQKQRKNNHLKEYLDAEEESTPLEGKTAEEMEELFRIEGDEDEDFFPNGKDTQSSSQSLPDKAKKQSNFLSDWLSYKDSHLNSK